MQRYKHEALSKHCIDHVEENATLLFELRRSLAVANERKDWLALVVYLT